MKIVAVTSCPTGIAHTFMAAEAIQRAAKAKGHEIFVETQGAGGLKRVPQDFLESADVAIFAADVEVREKERFASLPTVVGTVKMAIKDAAGLVTEAEQLIDGIN
jgi:fructose PTS system EIIBC or EIIC component